jgi:hypothetical protein
MNLLGLTKFLVLLRTVVTESFFLPNLVYIFHPF